MLLKFTLSPKGIILPTTRTAPSSIQTGHPFLFVGRAVQGKVQHFFATPNNVWKLKLFQVWFFDKNGLFLHNICIKCHTFILHKRDFQSHLHYLSLSTWVSLRPLSHWKTFWNIWNYRVCHQFILMKQDDYFRVNFDLLKTDRHY